MEALEQLRAQYAGKSSAEIRALIKGNKAFRQTLATLYVRVFKKRLNTDCSNCWLDAFVLLMRTSKKQLEAMKNRLFELKAGALLIDVERGENSKMATQHNLTDELALYHLRTNPKCIRLFTKYPANWQELVAEKEEEAPNEMSGEGDDSDKPTAEGTEAQEVAEKPKAKRAKK